MHQKNYVVIGGSKGIGLALVNDLITKGHHVSVFSRNRDNLPFHPHISHTLLDVTSQKLEVVLLPEIIDGLVYCPGSIVLKPFRSISEEQFLEDFRINCLGGVTSIKACLSGLKKSLHHPSIVMFSTVAVSQGMPYHTSIAVAKGGVEGLTKSLAAELAPNIRVNCIAPSLTQTDLASKLLSSPEKIDAASQRHPLKSIGDPNDIAAMAAFLLSEDAKWMTGQVMHIDGGISTIKS